MGNHEHGAAYVDHGPVHPALIVSKDPKLRHLLLFETSGGRYQRSAIGAINSHAAKIDVKQYLD